MWKITENPSISFEQRLHRVRRHVAAGEPRAAGRDDHVDARVGDPALHLGADLRQVVGDDLAFHQRVARLADHILQHVARFVGRLVARVGDRERRDAQGLEGEALVDLGHVFLFAISAPP
jgi:hypothetical protein